MRQEIKVRPPRSSAYVRESLVERNLVDAVEQRGGVAYKFSSPGRRNVPDRLVVLPNRSPFFVECKAPGQAPNAGQAREIARLLAMGQTVYILNDPDPERLLSIAAR
jgi:Holliday junction resolvase